MTEAAPRAAIETSARHFRIGWWSLLVFLTLGFGLEVLHGFKVGFYLDVTNETRRTMWRLAHAHGTLLAVLHVAFAATARLVPGAAGALASRCLSGASLLVPLGFFLGGVWVHGGDPGLGVLLVPVGAVLLFVAVLRTARAVAG